MQRRALQAHEPSRAHERQVEARRDLRPDVAAAPVDAAPAGQHQVEAAGVHEGRGQDPRDVPRVGGRIVEEEPVADHVGLGRGGHHGAQQRLDRRRTERDDRHRAVPDRGGELARLRDGAAIERVDDEVVGSGRPGSFRVRRRGADVRDRLDQGGDAHAAAA